MLLILSRKRILMLSALPLFLLLFVAYAYAAHPEMEKWKTRHQVIDHFDTTEKVIALTFDDGPQTSTTPKILEILQQYQAHATFFIVGQCLEKNPDIASSIVNSGSEIGNHSYAHEDFNTLSFDAMQETLQKTNALITRYSGKKPLWLRPPGGYLSIALVEKLVPQLAMQIAYWSYIQDSRDWETGQTAAAIAHHILSHLAPGQIILLHDGCQNSSETVKALEILLPELQKQGYRCFTLTEMEQFIADSAFATDTDAPLPAH